MTEVADPSERARLAHDACSGNAAAMAALGRHMLAELPYAPYDGIKITMEAAQKGDEDAAHLLAVLAACGAGLPQDWPTAFRYLHYAGSLGHTLAREQFVMLSGGRPFVSGSDGFAAIDVAPWLATPPAQPQALGARISIVPGFLPHGLCDWIVARAQPKLKPAQIYDRVSGAGRVENARTNSAMDFNIVESDMVVAIVREKIARTAGLPTTAMEHTSVLHYRPGQEFVKHFDFLDPVEPGYEKDIAERGQRLLTFLIYLSDAFDGGETAFPSLGWRHRGRKGDAVFFWNVTPQGALDRRTLHAGLATTRGEKWLLSQWIRGRV